MQTYAARVCRIIATLTVLLLSHAMGAQAAPYIAVKQCTEPCTTINQLKNDVRLSSLAFLPLGSIVFVSGEVTPLSAYVRICTGPRGGRDACPMTPDEVAAADLDNRHHARAATIRPITIPPEIAPNPSATPETIQQYITQVLNVTGPFGRGSWRNIIQGDFLWYEVLDTRSQTLEQVFINDVIVAKFSNGQSAEYKFVGPYVTGGMVWHLVEGSVRNADGSDPTASTPPPAAGGEGFANLVVAWQGSLSGWIPSTQYCMVRASVCSDADCSLRDYFVPCP
jgi:hypothetical protein